MRSAPGRFAYPAVAKARRQTIPTRTKQDTVGRLAVLLDESTAVFAVDYRGLTATEMAELRCRLHGYGSLRVVKNTLAERALYQGHAGNPFPHATLCGPTALVSTVDDPAVLAARLTAFAREHRALGIKGGRCERTMLRTPDAVHRVAALVSREAQLARVAAAVYAVRANAARAFAALLDDRKGA